MKRGKRICNALKEVRWFKQQMQQLCQSGMAVALVGVSLGLVPLTSCERKTTSRKTDYGSLSVASQTVEPHNVASDSVSILPVKVGHNTLWTGSQKSDIMIDYTEDDPSFPGGSEALLKFLQENVKYPEQAKEECISGRVVVGFVVEADGSITDPQIARGVHPLLDAEALRVVSLMPKWEPGRLGGKNVKQIFKLPVTFKLDE